MSNDESSIMNYGGGGMFDCAPGFELDPIKIMFGLIILYFLYFMYFKTDPNNNNHNCKTHSSNTFY
jgi:hypothetical protein